MPPHARSCIGRQREQRFRPARSTQRSDSLSETGFLSVLCLARSILRSTTTTVRCSSRLCRGSGKSVQGDPQLSHLPASLPPCFAVYEYRHVVLPSEIASLLPKGRLLSEVCGPAVSGCVCSLRCALQPCSPYNSLWLACRLSGEVWECSSPEDGSTTLSTGLSPTSCCSGARSTQKGLAAHSNAPATYRSCCKVTNACGTAEVALSLCDLSQSRASLASHADGPRATESPSLVPQCLLRASR